jgi:hypothetical protein
MSKPKERRNGEKMSNYVLKGIPPIKLTSLLKKKRILLKNYLKDVGISSYQTLLKKCEKMGVLPPEEKEFLEATEGKIVSSPQEGIIVVEPEKIVKESTGERVDVDYFPKCPVELSQKKKKKHQRMQSQNDPVTVETDE